MKAGHLWERAWHPELNGGAEGGADGEAEEGPALAVDTRGVIAKSVLFQIRHFSLAAAPC